MHDDQIELPALNGARVLVAQNDQFIAADLDLMIDDAGGKVVALAAGRDDALSLLGREPIDAAVVDPTPWAWGIVAALDLTRAVCGEGSSQLCSHAEWRGGWPCGHDLGAVPLNLGQSVQ